MFLFISRENKDIVKVNYIEYVNVALERIIDIGLERGRGISQTKGYNEIFVVAISRSKGRFPLVSFAYSDLMVGIPKVDFREYGGAI